jgi:hypothetical protein
MPVDLQAVDGQRYVLLPPCGPHCLPSLGLSPEGLEVFLNFRIRFGEEGSARSSLFPLSRCTTSMHVAVAHPTWQVSWTACGTTEASSSGHGRSYGTRAGTPTALRTTTTTSLPWARRYSVHARIFCSEGLTVEGTLPHAIVPLYIEKNHKSIECPTAVHCLQRVVGRGRKGGAGGGGGPGSS